MITISKTWLQDLLPQIVGQAGNFEVIVFGVLMVVILQRAPDGLWPALTKRIPVRAKRARGPSGGAARSPKRDVPAAGEVLLEVDKATKRFGGLVAVNEMALAVRAGEIVALIGPNGAGKSTMFNLVSGVLDPTSGSVKFRGQEVAGRASREIALMGMSRTFQHVRLLPQMSVLDNVAIGAHRREYRGLLAGVLTGAWRLDRHDEARLLAEAARQIERVGLADHMFDAAGSLPLGKQRILEIARALCLRPVPAAARRTGGRPALPREARARRTCCAG